MPKVSFPCPSGCGHRTQTKNRPCFFCESADKIGRFEREQRDRQRTAERQAQTRSVKHSHRHFVSGGKAAGQR